MSWFQALDADLFRFVNLRMSNRVCDAVLPFFSSNPFFAPGLVILAGLLVWKGGVRGRVFVFMMFLVLSLGDLGVVNTLKQALGRLRPFHSIAEAQVLVGKGGSGSFPSSHASSWFAATMIAAVYYRRSLWLMLPMAVLIGFSRVYLGVHYPSDVLGGAILGAGYAAAGLYGISWVWQWAGPQWFLPWWSGLPSLLQPDRRPIDLPKEEAGTDRHWLRLGYTIIFLIFFARLAYLGAGKINLAEDEAYQWLWSKHLAISYYSKPPLIAYTQFLGTTLWGDTEFGVRFFASVIATLLSILLLRFFAREVSVRAGFWLVMIIFCTPLLAVGATLMTIDPLLVLFWSAAMIAGWRAIQPESTIGHWAWVGWWMGLGFLSKYTAAFQIICWAIFFLLWRPARPHLRRPGPYLALFINLACTLPVILWNSRHGWITIQHVAHNARLDQAWEPTLRYFWEFLAAEVGLLNPVFFVAALWAMAAFWKRSRTQPLMVYFFSMGAPVFLGYWLWSFHSRVFPNWIAPAILPMFCLMVVYWDQRWREGEPVVKAWLTAGLTLGFTVIVILHDTNLITKAFGHSLPPNLDPLRRVRAWSDTVEVVGQARNTLLSEGKEVFIIGAHYGLVGLISFYLPEARAVVSSQPLAYYRKTARPENQFYFWPSYENRKGQNALYVQEIEIGMPEPTPGQLLVEFESVSQIGIYTISYRGRVFRQIQLFACRGLR